MKRGAECQYDYLKKDRQLMGKDTGLIMDALLVPLMLIAIVTATTTETGCKELQHVCLCQKQRQGIIVAHYAGYDLGCFTSRSVAALGW